MPTTDSQIPFSSELGRKGIHYTSLLIPLFAANFGSSLALWILVPISLLAVLADAMRARHTGFRAWIEKWFGFMMRSFELPETPRKIVLNGATWVLVAASLTFFLFDQWTAITAFSILILGDATAALVGRRFGRHPIGRTGKTYEGTAAFILSCLPLVLLLPAPPGAAIATGIIGGALSELLPMRLDDNIRIPIVAGLLITAYLYFAAT